MPVSLRERWPRTSALVAAAVLLASSVCQATDDAADGRKFFEMGAKAYTDGEYDAAIVAFKQAFQLTHRPGLLFSLAQAYRRAFEARGQVEQLREAVHYYTQYVSVGPADERSDQARDHLARLRAVAVSRGVELSDEAAPSTPTRLVVSSTVSGARLTLDGRQSGKLPRTESVSAGKHVVEVTAPGYPAFRKQVEVREGEVVAVNADWSRETASLEVSGNAGALVYVDGRPVGAVPTDARPLVWLGAPAQVYSVELRQLGHYTPQRAVKLHGGGSVQVDMPAPMTPRRAASWGLVGAGALSVAAGAVLGVLTAQADARGASARSNLDRDPNNALLRQQLSDSKSSRDGLLTATLLTTGGGLAAGAAGLVLLLTEGPGPIRPLSSACESSTSREPRAKHWTPSLNVGAGSVLLDLRTTF